MIRYIVEQEGFIAEDVPGLIIPRVNVKVKNIIDDKVFSEKFLWYRFGMDMNTLFDHVRFFNFFYLYQSSFTYFIYFIYIFINLVFFESSIICF
jgi:hypothetical protein